MIDAWLYSIISVIIVSLISLIGVLSFLIKEKLIKKSILFLVSFSAGSLFGGAFFHLLPEASKDIGLIWPVALFTISGIVVLFILEKFIFWRHCHELSCKNHVHSFAYMNLIGDGFHNFIDGLIIGGSYLTNIPLGIATTIAIIAHEVPQEIGDFGVLLHGGFSKSKALFFNLISSLSALMGAIIALLLTNIIPNLTYFLIPFAAGGFIYIAGTDLIPELHKETKISRSFLQFLAFLLGIAIMFVFAFLE